MKLETPRLILQSIAADDWPLFRRLYQEPEVIRYIADPMTESEIRARFKRAYPHGINTANAGYAW